MSTAKALTAPPPDSRPRASQARSFVAALCGAMCGLCLLAAGAIWLYGQWHARQVTAGLVVDASPAAAAAFARDVQRALIIALAAGLACLTPLPLLRGAKQDWERILDLMLQHKTSMRKMLLGSVLSVVVTMAVPMVLKHVLGEVVNRRHDATLLLVFFGVLGALLLLRAFASYLRTFHGQALAYRTATALRNRLFAHLQRLSFGFFDRSRQGELMSRLTNDVNLLQDFIRNGSEDFIVAPLSVIGGLAGVFYLNTPLALVILVVAALTGFLMQLFFKRMKKLYELTQRELGSLTAQMSEGINTIRLAQSFGLEEDSLGRFKDTNRAALKHILGHARLWGKLQPAVELLGFVAPLVIIFVLCWQAVASNAQVNVDELLAIVAYAALVVNPLGKLSRLGVTLSGGTAAMRRIQEVLDTRAEIADKREAIELPEVQGRIVFEHVSLAYGEPTVGVAPARPENHSSSPGRSHSPDAQPLAAVPQAARGRAEQSEARSNNSGRAGATPTALSNVNLEIEPGQVVAFVGESGSGKSSLIHLVPRFYEPTAGRVLVDGHDVRDVTLASLRAGIGIVSQDTILVHGTIRDNIAYGSPRADEKDIVDAAISANANSFIMELPKGYDTLVGERGVTLSGGQRQRIAIARALLRDPRILLLDEATSALDSVAEALVQDALNKLMYGRTTLMVAHRLSTVRNADRIIVLKAGRIVEQGSHDELMGRGGEYARLVKLQGVA